ncbi:cytochrome P450 [Nocardia brasiliensis]|uniref:cytochrome P450 n=1 Tax=Nocardia brasiliensis TaxID=37326 RepID=UPI00245429FC|nr:cytochrome P450 [Nocardia brasiliensis]
MTDCSPAVPQAPGRLPLVGHLVPLLRDPLALLRALPACGDLVRIDLGAAAVTMICDPVLTDYVLRHDEVFDKGGPFFERARDAVGGGLATCPHAAHRRLRRLVQPAFHPSRMSGYADVMTEHTAALADSWRDGQVLDVNAETKRLAATVTAQTLFSGTVSDGTSRQAVDDVTTLADSVFRRAMMPPSLDRLPTPGNRSFARARTRLYRTLAEIIADRRRSTEAPEYLLSALLAARDTEVGKHGLTDTEVADQIITFFIGGTETAASTLAWAQYLLDLHPDIFDRLAQEADAVLQGRPACFADLPRLRLAGRIITETLRLYPPGWLFTRLVTEDTELGGYPLRAGDTIAYSPYLIHHRGDLHVDPERFDPDRWDPARAQPARTALIPFGGGARKCIGDTFAITLSTLALATLCARWRLHTLPGEKIRAARSAALYPRTLRMRAQARNG